MKEKLFYKDFAVRELLEYDVIGSWDKFKKGEQVKLELIDGNVVVKTDTANTLLGVLPSEESKVIRMFLEMGHNVFAGTIICKNESASYSDMVRVAVYITK
ncbi:MAG: hypothetical protein IJN02_07460 [Bacteroidales bacterium]|nr:hypothetical protein [Bacteroidales bacterium]